MDREGRVHAERRQLTGAVAVKHRGEFRVGVLRRCRRRSDGGSAQTEGRGDEEGGENARHGVRP